MNETIRYVLEKKNPHKDGTLKGKSSIGDALIVAKLGKNAQKGRA